MTSPRASTKAGFFNATPSDSKADPIPPQFAPYLKYGKLVYTKADGSVVEITEEFCNKIKTAIAHIIKENTSNDAGDAKSGDTPKKYRYYGKKRISRRYES